MKDQGRRLAALAVIWGVLTLSLLPAATVATGAAHRFHFPIDLAGEQSLTQSPMITGIRYGQGTPEDPYVVEGWHIIPLAGYGIRIQDTVSHIVIRGNTIQDGERAPEFCSQDFNGAVGWCLPPPSMAQAGVVLRNASNVRVVHNHFSANTVGIYVESSQNVRVDSNIVSRARDARSPFTPSDMLIGRVFNADDAIDDIVGEPLWPYLWTSDDGSAGLVAVDSSVAVEDNVFANFVGFSTLNAYDIAVYSTGSQLFLMSNHIRDALLGLWLETTTVEARENVLENVLAFALRSYTEGVFRENVFRRAGGYVCGSGTSLALLSNHFVESSLSSRAPAAPCEGNYELDLSFASNTLRDSSVQIWSNGDIHGNRFENSTLHLRDFNPSVEENHFLGQQSRLDASGSESLLADNSFCGSDLAVTMSSTWVSAVTPTLRNNTFADTQVALRNGATGDADAASNWWGSEAGPGAGGLNRVEGNVSYSPWLTQPPDSARCGAG